jgi:hypothetical protein
VSAPARPAGSSAHQPNQIVRLSRDFYISPVATILSVFAFGRADVGNAHQILLMAVTVEGPPQGHLMRELGFATETSRRPPTSHFTFGQSRLSRHPVAWSFTDFSPVPKLPEEIYSSEILAILSKLEQVRRAMPNRTSAAPALDHIHCRAICDEIGERLRDVFGRVALEIPPRLLVLIDKLAQLDRAPSIVPSIDEMSFPRCPGPLASVKLLADLAPPATNRELASVGS